MAKEIERKFLVLGDGWRAAADAGAAYRQGYLASSDRATVRVRMAGERGVLTVKGRAKGITRDEFEYTIPAPDAEQMLRDLAGDVVAKIRYHVPYEGKTWEVDVFHGANDGLIVAEIELQAEDEPFAQPPWLGKDVTDDARYLNSSLARHPFTKW
jgi:adenylate cyclase